MSKKFSAAYARTSAGGSSRPRTRNDGRHVASTGSAADTAKMLDTLITLLMGAKSTSVS